MVTFREERSKDDLGGDQSGTILGFFFISYVFSYVLAPVLAGMFV